MVPARRGAVGIPDISGNNDAAFPPAAPLQRPRLSAAASRKVEKEKILYCNCTADRRRHGAARFPILLLSHVVVATAGVP